MFVKRHTEVLVVGAGPVGSVAGLVLAEEGVQVQVIDKTWGSAARSYALALHPGSLELLAPFGLVEPLLEQGRRVDSLAFYEGKERQAEIDFSRLPRSFPFLLVIPQSALEDTLHQQLGQKNVKLKWNHQLVDLTGDGGQLLARIDELEKDSVGYSVSTTAWFVGRTLKARTDFVVGADGHNSTVRRTLGVEYEDLGGGEVFGVFEFDTDRDPGHEVRIVLDGDTTSVLWPLPGFRMRWSFEVPQWKEFLQPRVKSRLLVQVGEGGYPHLGRGELEELVTRRAPWFDVGVGEIHWALAVRFERRLARAFGRDTVWLAGDAAHLTSPVGVQSMNVGLREAADLAARIASVLRQEQPPELLQSYDQERRAEWRTLLQGRLTAGNGAGPWVRRWAHQLLPCLPASGRDLEPLLGQLGLELARG